VREPRLTSILQRVAAGDTRAVSECVDEYGSLVWRLATRYLSRADAEIEDAVQEVFISVWMSADRFDPARGSEPAFIATIAHRRLTDYQRRTTARRKHEAHARDEAPLMIVDHTPPARDELHRISEEFNGLPDEERRALRMSLLHGLTQHEISEATGAPIGTVKSRLRRAMNRLCDSVTPRTQGAQS